MSSRLDRLLVLLDSGSSPAIRETAARQIAQFAAKNVAKDAGAEFALQDGGPGASTSTAVWHGTSSEWTDVMAVVGKILPYLHSKSFETRTAATSALSHICQMTPAWMPQNPPSPELSTSWSSVPDPAPEFPPFNVAHLLKEGALLLASSGKEYAEPVALGTPAEVARARKEAMNRLGLGFIDGVGDDELGLGKELSQSQNEAGTMELDSPLPHVKSSITARADSPAATPGDATSSASSPALSTNDIKPQKVLKIKTELHDPSDSAPESPGPGGDTGLSARERNRLKRKLKTGNSAFIASPSTTKNNPPPPAPPPNKVRVVGTEQGPKPRPVAVHPPSNGLTPATPTSGAAPEKVIIDPMKGGQVEAKEKAASQSLALCVPEGTWVWAGAVSVLLVDLFSPNWEIRHGAAMALREVIKTRGAAGGMKNGSSAEENFLTHEKWSNDLAAKFLCLFVLDRFSDFVSDQMVAPVRETVSQTLAALLTHMPRRSVLHVHAVLLQMVQLSPAPPAHVPSHPVATQNGKAAGKGKGKAPNGTTGGETGEFAWQVRHAGLGGIKYEVAVRPDLFDDPMNGKAVLKGVVDAAVSGLCDHDDDVRSVAATCLTPITSQIVERIPEEVGRVLRVLWDCLSDMKDDLSSSVGFIMELLGKLLSFDASIAILSNTDSGRPLSGLVPILFPFFRHTIANVRLAIVNTLHNFLSVPNLADDWIAEPVLRLLFQNLIIEERLDTQTVTLKAWRLALSRLQGLQSRLLHVISPLIRDWFTLLMTPIGVPIQMSLLYHHMPAGAEEGHNVDKSMVAQDLSLVSTETIIRARVAGSQALAIVLASWPVQEQSDAFGVPLEFYQESTSMLQQFLAATIVREWATESCARPRPLPTQSLRATSPLADKMIQRFFTYLQADPPPSYYEMYLNLSHISSSCRALLDMFQRDAKIPSTRIPALPTTIDTNGTIEGAFSIAMARDIVGSIFDELRSQVPRTKRKELPAIDAKQCEIVASISQYGEIKEQHDARVSAAVAGALIALREMPPKLNPVIRSVMNGVKFEENVELQFRAARSVAAFAAFSAAPGAPRSTATDKIVKNLGTFLCQDRDYAPIFEEWRSEIEGIPVARQNQILAASKSSAKTKVSDDTHISPEDQKSRLIRRGAQAALSEIAAEFGEKLFDTLPILWEIMAQPLMDAYPSSESIPLEQERGQGQAIIDCLTIIRSLAPTIHTSLHPRIIGLFPAILRALQSKFAILRQCAAQCVATLCNIITTDAMRLVVEQIIPFLADATVLTNKQGAIEAVYNIVKLLDAKALPYIIFLIVPVLGRMSDPDNDLRYLATNTFASLVKMVPLEAGLPDPPGFSPELLAKRETERAFLTQLLDGSKVENYNIPVPIQAELRRYQQDGVNWLAFLAKYQLHGILCDDMGLGKTLQSICILAGRHHERAEKYKTTRSPDSHPLPSLIVCPPTLVGHWYHEIKRYAETLRPMMYVGSVRERSKLASKVPSFDVVVTSYDVVRNDQPTLAKQQWHYCILDEGHVIKNSKAKLTKAVKTVQAHHRLILSGTPIQNNVLELWSLFDFLMPGFLGTEAFFNERFGKPITSSRDAKSSNKVKEAAALAVEALHKQVLPFLLRRLKEDVLNDLPPKIIQDYQCDLSELQKRLYDAYANSQAMASTQSAMQDSKDNTISQKHIFQSLQYLRKICNHPALVVKTPEDIEKLTPHGSDPLNIRDITHAPKLEALRQLLTDCGVGVAPTDIKDQGGTLEAAEATISQHRVLIFCQMRQMLDIIETELFRALMPTVTYMRLDGTTDPTKRHAIVETFNADPSIDCLLLTTHVGGLGLTLTGADTVIFVEHDWNPMKDLQAMDRAHRLGQKKVVNVYRLITKGTLEEKIMGLQRFKLNIANSVITQQNSGLASMDTDLILDLFKRTNEGEDAAAVAKKKEGPVTTKNVLEGLDELPPDDEYNFDLSSFLGTLGK